MSKKLLALLISLLFVFTLGACTSNEPVEDEEDGQNIVENEDGENANNEDPTNEEEEDPAPVAEIDLTAWFGTYADENGVEMEITAHEEINSIAFVIGELEDNTLQGYTVVDAEDNNVAVDDHFVMTLTTNEDGSKAVNFEAVDDLGAEYVGVYTSN